MIDDPRLAPPLDPQPALSLADYWQGRDVTHAAELTWKIRADGAETVRRCNELLAAFGEPRAVNSGWRPASINATTSRASPTSLHLWGAACDLRDPAGDLDQWCLDNPDVLEGIGLWQESPASTPGWCHVQIAPPHSGRRVFQP